MRWASGWVSTCPRSSSPMTDLGCRLSTGWRWLPLPRWVPQPLRPLLLWVAEAEVDVREVLAAFRDERLLRVDDVVPDLWAPLSGDYRTADGWARLHCNFDHHREAVLRALGLPNDAGADKAKQACASRTSHDIEDAVTAMGGCAAALRRPGEWRAHEQARVVAKAPLVGMVRLPGEAGPETLAGGRVRQAAVSPGRLSGAAGEGEGPGSARLLEGVRVLDLTRVIAGPVAARTLAAYGADVLRVGAEHLPEVPGLVISTAFGKRSCHLDLRTRDGVAALRDLVRGADVVVQGYRPGALARLGFGAEELAELRPGIVSVELSAYGRHGPWGGRRGFDSLVQMVTGIAYGDPPRPLPAQVLDHATGYLAAFGAMAALLRRRREGGSWRVELCLARTAQWLDELGRGEPEDRLDLGGLLGEMESSFGRLTYVLPPGRVGGKRPGWEGPPPHQGEHPAVWW